MGINLSEVAKKKKIKYFLISYVDFFAISLKLMLIFFLLLSVMLNFIILILNYINRE